MKQLRIFMVLLFFSVAPIYADDTNTSKIEEKKEAVQTGGEVENKIDNLIDGKKQEDQSSTIKTNSNDAKNIEEDKKPQDTQPKTPEKKETSTLTKEKKPAEDPMFPVYEFNALHSTIYSGLISEDEARNKFHEIIPKISKLYYKNGGKKFSKKSWVFPVGNYTYKKCKLSKWDYMYKAKYDYFNNEISGDHPAFDLFINDLNQDCLDDDTEKPINILSVTGGIVVACIYDWTEDMGTSGGNNILIYDPYLNGIFYYAHNNEVLVKPGDIVRPGTIIATMGRTGKKAFKPGSPTHLHVSYLKVKPYDLSPVNIYLDLKKMRPLKK